MFWDNFWVDRTLTEAEMQTGMAALFRIPQANVLVVPDIKERPDTVSSSLTVVVPTLGQGNYPQRLDVYLFAGIADDWVGKHTDRPRFRAQELISFCNALSCECLLPGETANPAEWLNVAEYGVRTILRNENALP